MVEFHDLVFVKQDVVPGVGRRRRCSGFAADGSGAGGPGLSALKLVIVGAKVEGMGSGGLQPGRH